MQHTIGRLRRQVIRTAAVSGLVLASATTGLIVPGAATAADLPLGTYTATIGFADKFVQAASPHTFELTFTNVSGTSNYLLEKATATLAGFSVTAADAGAGWTASITGSTVTIAPDLVVTGLLDGESVDVAITAAGPAVLTGNNTIATTASGVLGSTGLVTDFVRQGDDPSFLLAPYATTDACNAGEACDTGYTGDPNHTEARAVSSASPTPDVVGITVGTDEGACGTKLKPEGKSRAVTVDSLATDRVVTVTIQLDKSKVNETAPNGVGRAVVCHESPKPFRDASGNSVTAGLLPACAGITVPCLASLTKTGAGDFLATVRQPGGDPKSVMGYPIPGT